MEILPAMLLGMLNGEEIRIKNVYYPEIEFGSFLDLSESFDFELSVFSPELYRYETFKLLTIEKPKKTKEGWSYNYRGVLQCQNSTQQQKMKEALLEAELFSKNLKFIKYGEDHTDYHNVKNCQLYPRKQDLLFPDDYITLKHKWTKFDLSAEKSAKFKEMSSRYTLSFTADRPSIYQSLETQSSRQVFQDILEKDRLVEHPIFSANYKTLTLGNEFCPLLFPAFPLLKKLLNKAANEGLQVTIAYPFLRQTQIGHLKKALAMLDEFSTYYKMNVEMTINDWGVFNILKNGEFPFIQPVVGRLLNKRQKDVRFQWKWKVDQYDQYLQSNMLNEPIVTTFLQNNHITRYHFETHPHINQITGFGHSLYFPFYQINTSIYCKFDEIIKNNTSQKDNGCTRICEDVIQVFPSHLKALERGNTIFGFCDSILQEPDLLRSYINHGIDRLVYTAL